MRVSPPRNSTPPSQTVFAAILAGGGGTRLWPASRRRRPKQLLRLGGPESLLAAAARRAQQRFGLEHILVVTAADQEEQIRQEIPGLPRDNVIVEPEPRNTAAAVGLAAVVAARRGGLTARLAVLPADSHIADEAAFDAALGVALAHAHDAIVTIGLRPSRPETGFGYIRAGDVVVPPAAAGGGAAERADSGGAGDAGAAGDAPGVGVGAAVGQVRSVLGFVEKPDRPRAEAYLRSGDYLWNSGMFFLTAGRMLEEARRHLPALGAALDAFLAAPELSSAVRSGYAAVPAISIDHGIIEKAEGLRVVPAELGWNDVGSWSALSAIRPNDADGNVVVGGCFVSDSHDSVVISETDAPFVGVVGVEGLVVVATADAVLVIPKDRAQDVKTIIEAIKTRRLTHLL
jgi:mannose-1-phosphate guanylyltransferase